MGEIKLDGRSIEYRMEILRIVDKVRRGHIASAFSIMEILRVFYEDVLRIDPGKPKLEDRDRFILSKGHGCLALYVALAEKGFFPKSELYNFCREGAILGGHPDADKVPGVEASTGSLGHGLPIGAGFALNGKLFGKDYRTFVVLGDGECNEGSVWEAALFAGKHKLNRLTAIVDYNKMQCFGKMCDVLNMEPFADKWKSFGFDVKEADGHDVGQLRKVLSGTPFHKEKPGVLICHTIKGKGIASMEGQEMWHHNAKISDEEMKGLFEELGGQK